MTSTPSEDPSEPDNGIPANDSTPEWPSAPAPGTEPSVETEGEPAPEPTAVEPPVPSWEAPSEPAPAPPPWTPPAAQTPPVPPPWTPPAAQAPPAAPAWAAPTAAPPADWTGQVPQPGVRYDVPQDQKNLAMISTLGMIIAGFISPLIVFIITNGDPAKKFANDHAKEGLNFCIASFVAGIVTVLLIFVLVGLLLIPLLIGWSIWVIVAGAIQANNGEAPHYPLVPKILK